MDIIVQEREVSPYALHGGKLVCEKYEKNQRGFLFRKKTIRLSQQELDELSREYTLRLIAASELAYDSTYACWLIVSEVASMKGSVWSFRLVDGLGETVSRIPVVYRNTATPRALIDFDENSSYE